MNIILLLMQLVTICYVNASPSLVFSTMVSDSLWYYESISSHGRYAADVDEDGNMYVAVTYYDADMPFEASRGIQVFRINADGADVNLIQNIPLGSPYCTEIKCMGSFLYLRVVSIEGIDIIKIDKNGAIQFMMETPLSGTGDPFLIDTNGAIYIFTSIPNADVASTIVTTADAFDHDYNGETDILIQKYSPDGELLYSSFFGGSKGDSVSNAVFDNNGNIILDCANLSEDIPINFENDYVKGMHHYLLIISPDFATFTAYYSALSAGDVMIYQTDYLFGGKFNYLYKCTHSGDFIWRMDFSGELPVINNPVVTYKTASERDPIIACVDERSRIYSVHHKRIDSPFTATSDAFFPDPKQTGIDIGIWQITQNTELLYGTYFGGHAVDETTMNAVTFRDGKLYVVGYTNSPDFPLTPGSFIDIRTSPIPGKEYPWGLFAFCIDFTEPTEVAEEATTVPEALILDPPHPNPFNPATTISFTLPEAGFARLAVYNISGQLMRELTAENLPAGQHEVVWDGRDSGGAQVSSGVYIARLAAGDRAVVQKVTLVR